MPDPWDANPDSVIEFLRQEAPLELERLQSLAQVVRLCPEHLRGAVPRDPYRRWMHDSFELFDSHRQVGGAA